MTNTVTVDPDPCAAIPSAWEQGQYYADRTEDGRPYIVAQVGSSRFCLVSLSDGNRYEEPVVRGGDIFAGNRSHFVLLPRGTEVMVEVGQ